RTCPGTWRAERCGESGRSLHAARYVTPRDGAQFGHAVRALRRREIKSGAVRRRARERRRTALCALDLEDRKRRGDALQRPGRTVKCWDSAEMPDGTFVRGRKC